MYCNLTTAYDMHCQKLYQCYYALHPWYVAQDFICLAASRATERLRTHSAIGRTKQQRPMTLLQSSVVQFAGLHMTQFSRRSANYWPIAPCALFRAVVPFAEHPERPSRPCGRSATCLTRTFTLPSLYHNAYCRRVDALRFRPKIYGLGTHVAVPHGLSGSPLGLYAPLVVVLLVPRCCHTRSLLFAYTRK
jgi:hypothetical protein